MRGLTGAKRWILFGLLALVWTLRPALAAEWTPIGPPGGVVKALVVDPSDPRILYVASAGGGLFKSVDGGASWQPANHGLSDFRITALAIDPQRPRTLYVAAGVLPTVSGVFKSTDGGASWVRASQGLPSPPPFCGCGGLLSVNILAVGRNGIVYASGGGVSRSADKARNWGLVLGGFSVGVTALAIDPSDPRTVYAASTQGLYKSGDNGLSWNLVAVDGGPPPPQALAVDPRVPGTVYAGTASGVFKSADGGAHWQEASAGLHRAAVLTFAVQDGGAGSGPSVVFAGTSTGVFKSIDGGAQWTPASNGLQGFAIGALAADPQSPGVLWAGAAAGPAEGPGLFKTVSAGGLWRVANQGFFAAHVRSVAVSADRRLVFAGSDSRGVLRSLNGGVTWAEANQGLVHRSVQALALGAGTQTVYAGTPDGVFRSTDRGASWEAATAGLRDPVTDKIAAVEALAFDPRQASTLYAAGGSGLYVSHDGVTWKRLPVPQLLGDRAVHGVAVDPTSSSRLLAGHAAGILRSANGGATWSHPGLPIGASLISSFAFDRSRPGRVYAGGLRGVVRSDNGGATWSGTGLPWTTVALAVDVRGIVYAATWLGVYRSTDRGTTWTASSGNFVAANGLALAPGGLYAALDGGGVQRLVP